MQVRGRTRQAGARSRQRQDRTIWPAHSPQAVCETACSARKSR